MVNTNHFLLSLKGIKAVELKCSTELVRKTGWTFLS